MMTSLQRLLLVLLAACLVLPMPASASTVVELNFDELTNASDAIIIGHVESVTPHVHNNRVYSTIKIKVGETLKGDVVATVKIVQVGGQTEELVTRAFGMPVFTAGEHVLLFLEKPASVDHYVVTGLAQGKKLLVEQDGKLTLRDHPVPVHTIRPTKFTPIVAPTSLDSARARIQSLTAP